MGGIIQCVSPVRSHLPDCHDGRSLTDWGLSQDSTEETR